MRTPAHASCSGQGRGFTLIEILVVLLIIGIMIGGVMFSVTLARDDRDLENERDRILAITDQLRDQAALQNREYGLRCFDGGYEFLVFDPQTGLWGKDEDDLLRARELPHGLSMRLYIEGRQVVLPEAAAEPDELAPQVLLYSSGELNLFELELRREGGATLRIAPSATSDRIEATLKPAEAA